MRVELIYSLAGAVFCLLLLSPLLFHAAGIVRANGVAFLRSSRLAKLLFVLLLSLSALLLFKYSKYYILQLLRLAFCSVGSIHAIHLYERNLYPCEVYE